MFRKKYDRWTDDEWNTYWDNGHSPRDSRSAALALIAAGFAIMALATLLSFT